MPPRRGPRFKALQVVALFCLLSLCGVLWLARDICRDRGGVPTAYFCETAQGDIVSPFSLLEPRAIFAIAAIVAVGIGVIWALVAALWRKVRS